MNISSKTYTEKSFLNHIFSLKIATQLYWIKKVNPTHVSIGWFSLYINGSAVTLLLALIVAVASLALLQETIYNNGRFFSLFLIDLYSKKEMCRFTFYLGYRKSWDETLSRYHSACSVVGAEVKKIAVLPMFQETQ